jgi:long-chain acyl-CoA synthetase
VVLASGGRERFTTALHLRDDLASVRPAFLTAVPLLLETLHARVLARLASQGAVRAAVASALIRASEAHVVARRRARGVDLGAAATASSANSGPIAAAWLATLAAAAFAIVLFPLHALARLLVWKKIREALGVTKAVVSGGASLPPHLETFFEAAGLALNNGWGLSETSPVLTCRCVEGAAKEEEEGNVRGTVGRPLPGTELRVVDPETLRPLPPGEKGLILARGPGVFAGYLDDPEATAAAFPSLPDDDEEEEDGGNRRWFSTGDLGAVLPESAGAAMRGCVVLSGRSKDTIVLLSGENVEPEPLEAALAVSPLIKHALVIGGDRRELGVLVFPSEEAEERAAGEDGNGRLAVEHEIAADVARLNAAREGYRPWEHVARVEVAWGAALTPEDGTLTRTFKVRRAAVVSRYAAEHARLLAHLRG